MVVGPYRLLQTTEVVGRQRELDVLTDCEPYLVVLDGIERLLLAYSRSDASRLADDDLNEQATHNVAWAMGLPPSAGCPWHRWRPP